MKESCYLFIICCCISIQTFSQQRPAVANPLQITLQNLDSNKPSNKNHFRYLRINITNTADTAFSFSIMSCSWDWSMAFNPGIIHRDYLGCLKNIPKTITLQPKKTFVLEDNFKLSDTTINHPLSISTGFKVIKPADDFFLSFFEFDYDPNAEHFTWSKPIIISF